MAQRSISVKLPHLEKAFSSALAKELVKLTPVVGKAMQDRAREDHRYTHRTHKLEKSTKWAGTLAGIKRGNKRGLTLKATKDYAKYVINGHGTWLPDRFLDKTINDLRLSITSRMMAAVRRATREVNK